MPPINLNVQNKKSPDLVSGLMPEAMEPVISAVGLKSTLELIDAFAGQVFTIPKHPRGAGHARFKRIEQTIGIDAALQLSANFGGERIAFPRLAILKRALRNQEIIRDFDEALKVMSAATAANELATKYELTYRQIEMIVNGKAINTRKKVVFKEGAAPERRALKPLTIQRHR